MALGFSRHWHTAMLELIAQWPYLPESLVTSRG
jgi:hypothetical protein